MADYTENEWRQKYKPTVNPTDGSDCYVPGEEEIVLTYEEQFIWTEIWDWDANTPLMVSGFLSEEEGAISWYICEVARNLDLELSAEKSED